MEEPITGLTLDYNRIPLVCVTSHEFDRGVSNSFGLIVYCTTTKRFFMVRRKHKNGIVRIFWGRFHPCDLINIIFLSPDDQIDILLKAMESYDNYQRIYREFVREINEETVKKTYKHLIRNKDIILRLIEKKPSSSLEDKNWIWPKGQKEKRDVSSKNTAIREFLEESGLQELPCNFLILPDKVVIKNRYNNRDFIDTFWLCVVEEEFDVPELAEEDIEISARKWIDSDAVEDYLVMSHIPFFPEILKRFHCELHPVC